MKVIFCTYDFGNYYNGPNSWMRRLLPNLRAQGIDIEVLFIKTSDAGPAFHDLRQQGFDCPYFNWYATTQDKIAWILQEVGRSAPDIFFANLVVPAYFAGRWIRDAGIPTVGVLHSDDPFNDAIIDEFVVGDPRYRTSVMVCVSDWQRRALLAKHPNDTIVARIPYCTPIPSQTAARPGQRLRLVYTGRFVETQKRVSDLTRALCRAVREVSGTEAVLYGDGEARPAVERIIAEEDGTDVLLAGIVDATEIQDKLCACHAITTLSDFEGLPISILEAMACGVVPICLNIRSGVPELIEHNKTGLLIDNRGEDFVNAVRRLRTEPHLWARLSRGAKAKVVSGYSLKGVVDDWVKLFSSLMRGRPAGLHHIPSMLELPPVHPELACEDFRESGTVVGPRFSSEDFLAAGKRCDNKASTLADTHLGREQE